MRARLTNTTTQVRRKTSLQRRPRRPEAAPEALPPFQDDLADERRMRESGGPDDRATYSCSCGFVFDAQVSTSVGCPHCGNLQAW